MDFYKKLHSSDLKPNNDDIHELLNIIIRPHLTQDQVDILEKPLSPDEAQAQQQSP